MLDNVTVTKTVVVLRHLQWERGRMPQWLHNNCTFINSAQL